MEERTARYLRSQKNLTAKKALICRMDVSGHCVHVLGLRRGRWHRDGCPSRQFPATQTHSYLIALHVLSKFYL